MAEIKRRGLMLVLSSPSGAGKTTISRKLLAIERERMLLSVSVTTRKARPGEIEGRDYYFIDRAKFDAMVTKSELLEHATVFGNSYGTPRAAVEAALAQGRDVLFDIDHPGKDTYRHREAGAFEVVVASDRRLALIREFEQPATLSVHHLLAELYDGVDWVLVEGFKSSNLLKVEVWRADAGKPARYPDDDFIVAIATDSPDRLPQETLRPVLDLNAADAVAQWLVDHGDRFEYNAENYG